jgi:hypothetical protein
MTTSPFPPDSRYANTEILTRTRADGTVESYLARRILPSLDRFVPLDHYRLTGAERVDGLASDAYGDAFLWWRIVDASGEPDPANLTGTEGRLVVIPIPLEIADGTA